MKRDLSSEQKEDLLKTLRVRFEKNRDRHPDLEWDKILTKLNASPEKLNSLYEMESTEGEPDLIAYDANKGEYIFCDCSTESPKGRRSICYDSEALDARKEHKPNGNVIDMAKTMGIELLTEDQYRELQTLGSFDMKTSSWIKTPPEIRKLGGALFADFRYNQVFVYHNGASSYYAARGFRGLLRV